MFTGIVEEVGTVLQLQRRGEDAVLTLQARQVLAGTQPGDSIAVNGVCLTVIDLGPACFRVDLSQETLARSTLGRLHRGAPVNLERALAVGGRLGGHFVQGHVDGTGVVQRVTGAGRGKVIRIQAPAEVLRYIVHKGFIAVDGMSLTVVDPDAGGFQVAFIPHTLAHSVAQFYRPGTQVNLEADILAKYAERLLAGQKTEDVDIFIIGLLTKQLRAEV